MGLASIDKLIALEVLLQLLNDLDTHLEIMSTVSKDKLTDLLTLVWTLLDQRTVVAEQVLAEKFVEFIAGCVLIFVDFHSKLLAEHERICETSIDRREASQHHSEEGVEGCDFSA